MKKALSVFLAIMMLFAALSVGASAAYIATPSPYHTINGGPVNMDQAVCYFDLNSCTMANPVSVYVTGDEVSTWKTVENLTGTWWMIPNNSLPGVEQTMRAGWRVTLPTVIAPAGYQFDGWYCYNTGDTYAANGTYTIKAEDVGGTISFRAACSPTKVDDNGSNAINILTKVFGTIIGIFVYSGDIDKGIALITKMLGSIFA